MNDAFAAFLHALPTLIGGCLVLVALYGFWRGLSLKPKPENERAPDPVSPSQALSNSFASPAVWPRWLRRLFGQRD